MTLKGDLVKSWREMVIQRKWDIKMRLGKKG
jgi:hypothetical protein